MQRRFRPALLKENPYGTNYPAPQEHTLDLSRLDGGLNLWELDYRMASNQSPDMLNMWWKDGVLGSRPGQDYLYEPDADDVRGAYYASYRRPWKGCFVMHKGTKLYAVHPETGDHLEIFEGPLTEGASGTFFVFGDKLYYMNGHEYVVIDRELNADFVTGYVPTVVINRKGGDPEAAGGDIYEDENRLSAWKTVKFTADGEETDFYLPTGFFPVDVEGTTPKLVVKVDGEEMTPTTDYTYDNDTGCIVFGTAPDDTDENNVEVTLSKANADAKASILRCGCATVYGTGTDTVVVCGGTEAQPNAYFWSGNTSLGFDPTYFPMANYNFAGLNDEFITAFGKQQNMLIIFKERSIGKTTMETVTADGLTSINLPYKRLNDETGCDLEGSVQLVENNLVFANRRRGVFVIANTSEADENNIIHISRNIDGDRYRRGLLHDIDHAEGPVNSYDDGEHYWIAAGDHAYVWDYRLGSYRSKEEKLAWFLFDNVQSVSWFTDDVTHFYGRSDGALVKFVERYADFGVGYKRRYQFATQHFGTYDVLKDVVRVIFAIRSDTDTTINITYKTDYEERDDLTPIRGWGWKLAPRNLSKRSLKVIPFAATAIRMPRCFHIRHFTMILTNSEADSDMSVVGAQIVYRYHRRDR